MCDTCAVTLSQQRAEIDGRFASFCLNQRLPLYLTIGRVLLISAGWPGASPLGLQHLAEERGGAWVARRAKDLPRLALFLNHALVDEDHPVGYFAGKAHFVSHDHHGHPLAGEVFHHLQHVAHQLRIQRRRGLIEQHNRRLHRQRTGDGYPLLLAAGQARGPGVALIA